MLAVDVEDNDNGIAALLLLRPLVPLRPLSPPLSEPLVFGNNVDKVELEEEEVPDVELVDVELIAELGFCSLRLESDFEVIIRKCERS